MENTQKGSGGNRGSERYRQEKEAYRKKVEQMHKDRDELFHQSKQLENRLTEFIEKDNIDHIRDFAFELACREYEVHMKYGADKNFGSHYWAVTQHEVYRDTLNLLQEINEDLQNTNKLKEGDLLAIRLDYRQIDHLARNLNRKLYKQHNSK